MSFPTFRTDPVMFSPGLLKQWMGPHGTAYREVLADEGDNLLRTFKLVGQQRSPLLCDASVLPLHSRDRRIRRYTNESESSIRRRLAKWLQIHQSAGRAWGMLRQLRIYLQTLGRPLIRHVCSAGDGSCAQWSTLNPGDGTRDYFEVGGIDPEYESVSTAPSNWLWDAGATTGKWSRFWILIYTSGLTSATPTTTWDGDGEWDSGSDYWDGYLTAGQVQDIVDLCNDWKAAHSQLEGVFLVHDDSLFDPTGSGANFPDGTWDTLIDPTTGAFNRAENVTYAYERP